MPVLSLRERRLVVAGAVIAVVVGGYFWGVEPLRDRFEAQRSLIPAREAVLAKSRLLLAQQANAAQGIQEAEAELAQVRETLLPGETPALAASELQKSLKSIADGAGVEMRSERVLPAVDREGFLEIPIEVTLACKVRELVHFLHRLEQMKTVLTLSDFKVRVVAAGQPRDLLATLTVSGYMEKRKGG